MLFQIPKQKRILGILTSRTEIRDLLKGWIVITIAFTILMYGLTLNSGTFSALLLSAVTVGTGFLLHELAHKFVAQYYHCWAEFRANDTMLLVALFSSLFGFLFPAPGAVMIDARGVTKKQNGLISLAGPATNFVLAVVFLLCLTFVPMGDFLQLLCKYGAYINVWLGIFNMIPFGPLDGKKIYAWDKTIWGLFLFVGIVLFKMAMG